jgi:hypothetical protein
VIAVEEEEVPINTWSSIPEAAAQQKEEAEEEIVAANPNKESFVYTRAKSLRGN